MDRWADILPYCRLSARAYTCERTFFKKSVQVSKRPKFPVNKRVVGWTHLEKIRVLICPMCPSCYLPACASTLGLANAAPLNPRLFPVFLSPVHWSRIRRNAFLICPSVGCCPNSFPYLSNSVLTSSLHIRASGLVNVIRSFMNNSG